MKYTLYWFQIRENYSIASVLRLINSIPFDIDKDWGFRIESSEGGELVAKYILKRELVDKVEDPFGNVIEQNRTVYETFIFRVIEELNVVELVNPGKRLGKFRRVFENNSFVSIKLLPLRIDFEKVRDTVSMNAKEINVLGVETGNFLIKSRTNCRATFSALVDVQQDVDYFLGNREFSLESMRVGVGFENSDYIIDVFSTGRVVLRVDPLLDNHRSLVVSLRRQLSKNEVSGLSM